MTNSIVPLGRDENVLSSYDLTYSLSLFFLKSQFAITNKRFITASPNVWLIIPLGKSELTYPFNNIATVACSTEMSIKELLFGIISIVVGVSLKSFWGILVLALGIILVVGSFKTVILIRNNSGARIAHNIAPWERAEGQKMVSELNQAIADRL